MTIAATNTNWAGAAGNAAVSFCAHWIGRGLVFAFRHPIETGMTLMLGLGIAMGATNAMFLQTVRHPAPLFMDTAGIARPAEPVSAGTPVPMRQPIPTALHRPVPTLPASETPVSVTVPDTVGNKDVAELQARLTELGYFSGKIDGYYGPKTAGAIRRFETEAGLTPVGAVTPEVLAAARVFQPPAVPQPAAQPAPAPVAAIQPMAAAPVETTTLPPADDPIGRIAASVADEQSDIASVAPAEVTVPAEPAATKPSVLDPELVRMVQTGLSRLGFLHAQISGKFDAETARAIREFENYNNYRVTGELTPDLIDVLMAAGAFN